MSMLVSIMAVLAGLARKFAHISCSDGYLTLSCAKVINFRNRLIKYIFHVKRSAIEDSGIFASRNEWLPPWALSSIKHPYAAQVPFKHCAAFRISCWKYKSVC